MDNAKCYLSCCNRPATEGHPICLVHLSKVYPKTREAITGPLRAKPGSDAWMEGIMKTIAAAYYAEVHCGA